MSYCRKGICKLFGAEPYVLPGLGNPLYHFVALCLASRGLPITCPVSSHVTHFPYMTGALPTVALVVNPRVDGFVYIVSLCGLFKLTLLKIWQFLLPLQTTFAFYSRKLWEYFFLALDPWAVWSGLGLGWLTPKVSLLIFTQYIWMWNHPFCCRHHHPAPHHVSRPPHPPLRLRPSYLSRGMWLL